MLISFLSLLRQKGCFITSICPEVKGGPPSAAGSLEKTFFHEIKIFSQKSLAFFQKFIYIKCKEFVNFIFRFVKISIIVRRCLLCRWVESFWWSSLPHWLLPVLSAAERRKSKTINPIPERQGDSPRPSPAQKAHREVHGAHFLQGEEGGESGEIKLPRHDPAASCSFDRW